MILIVGSEIALSAERRPGKINLSRSHPPLYSPEGRKDIKQEYRKKRIEPNMAQKEQEENIEQMQQGIVDAEKKIALEQTQVRNLETKLAATATSAEKSQVAEQRSFFANKLAQAKQKISALKNIIVNNKGKIIATIAALGALGRIYLAYKAIQNSYEEYKEEETEYKEEETQYEKEERREEERREERKQRREEKRREERKQRREEERREEEREEEEEERKVPATVEKDWRKVKKILDPMTLEQATEEVKLAEESFDMYPPETQNERRDMRDHLNLGRNYIEWRKLDEQNQKKA